MPKAVGLIYVGQDDQTKIISINLPAVKPCENLLDRLMPWIIVVILFLLMPMTAAAVVGWLP